MPPVTAPPVLTSPAVTPPVERPWPDLPATPPAAATPSGGQAAPPPVVENPWPELTRPAARAIEAPPVPPRRPPVPPPPPPPPPPASEPFDWENLVGVKLFSGIAGVALLLAAIFFLRYSVQQGWLQPPVRVAIGIIVAIGLLIACELKSCLPRSSPRTRCGT